MLEAIALRDPQLDPALPDAAQAVTGLCGVTRRGMVASRRVPGRLQFIGGLLTRDMEERLGSGLGGRCHIMEHPFFAGIAWPRALAGKLPPPFVPRAIQVRSKPWV